MDGSTVFNGSIRSTDFEAYVTSGFTLGSGSHTITLTGSNPTAVELDNVTLCTAGTNPADNGFESTDVSGDYAYQPTSNWTFGSTAGVAADGGSFSIPGSHGGSQVAFIQSDDSSGYNDGNPGSASQSVHLTAGNYVITLNAAEGDVATSQGIQTRSDSSSLTYNGTSNGDGGDKYAGLDRFGRIVDQRWLAGNGTILDRYQFDSSGNGTDYIWSPVYVDALLFRVGGGADGSYYATYDANYNVTSIYSSGGSSTQERFLYSAYGVRTVLNNSFSSTSDTTNWLVAFQGLIWDGAVGMYYARNRWYSPSLMRWISWDPTGYSDGMDPNVAYADNPINRKDPSGLLATVNDINGTFKVTLVPETSVPKYAAKIAPAIYATLIRNSAWGYEAEYKPDAAHSTMGMSIHFGQVIKSVGRKVEPHWDTADDWVDPKSLMGFFDPGDAHKRGLPSYTVNPSTGRSDSDHAGGALGLSGMYSFFDSPGANETTTAYTWEIELIAFTPCRNRILGAARFDYTNAAGGKAATLVMAAPWALAAGGGTIPAQPPSSLAADVIKKW